MNPLTDELTPEAKAELAAVFAEMKQNLNRRFLPPQFPVNSYRPFQFQRRGW